MPERKLNGLSGPTEVRCFVGALVAEASARRLRAGFLLHYPEFAGSDPEARHAARLVPLSNLHVTVRFLGQVPAADLPRLAELVTALGARPVAVEVVGYAGLPGAGRARLAVADLAPHPELEDWKARLEQVVGVEDRPFRPHVTLVRFRDRGKVTPVRLAQALTVQLQAPQLFRSDQVRGGVRYSPVSAPPP